MSAGPHVPDAAAGWQAIRVKLAELSVPCSDLLDDGLKSNPLDRRGLIKYGCGEASPRSTERVHKVALWV